MLPDLLAHDAAARNPKDPRKEPVSEIRLSCQAVKWRNVVALSWAGAGEQPVRVVLHRNNDEWTVRAGTRKI